jgi:hypothetical protein
MHAGASRHEIPNLPERPETTDYLSSGAVDRVELLQALTNRLRKNDWNLRMDSGWSDHDLEVPAHPLVRLRLTTVSEDLHQGRRNLRCRIEGLWSLPAKLTFWSATLICLLLVERLAQLIPWIWLILPLPVLVAWWIDDAVQTHSAAFGSELDAVAGQLQLVPISKAAIPGATAET